MFAHRFEAELVFYHAYNYTSAEALFAPSDVLEGIHNERSETAVKRFQDYQQSVRERCGERVKTDLLIEPGFAVDGILRSAEELNAGLIVMGTTGAGNIATKLLGSVTTSVINRANCPVLAVPVKAGFKKVKRIAYATDFQEKDLRAVYTLADFARRLHAEVLSVHVTADRSSNRHLKLREHSEDLYWPEMEFNSFPLHIVEARDPLRGLSDFIREQKVDFLALMTRHNRAYFDAILRGSLTRDFALHAEIPILSLHG
jgi:nucleotide-binding universal stress UspA family protein